MAAVTKNVASPASSFVELLRASDASRMAPLKGGPGTSIRANVPGWAQDSPEGFRLAEENGWMASLSLIRPSHPFI